MNARRVWLIARYTAREAIRTRVLHVGGGALAAWFALTLFVGELAITESVRMRTAVFAGGARMLLVFIVSLYVAQSIAREYSDRTLELVLGRPVSRPDYYLGKFVGSAMVALALTALAPAMTMGSVSFEAAAKWGCGLALEVILATAATLFAVSSIGQLLPAMIVSLAFYLLARTSDSLLILAHASKTVGDGPGMRIVFAAADVLARVLPDLSRFAPTALLLGESPHRTLAYAAIQTLLYCVILTCAGMLDMQRKDL